MSGLVDVVIIGGGIIGCACAYYLSAAGVRVRLLESGDLAEGASKAGMSHVVTWEEPAEHLALARASQRLYEQLQAELPVDIEYRKTGSLAVVERVEKLGEMIETLRRLREFGIIGQLLDAADLAHLEPNLAPGLAGGAYFPGDGMVNPLFVTQGFAQAARKLGAQISTHNPVTSFERDSSNRVTAVQTQTENIPCGQVIIAAGAWTGQVSRLAGVILPIQPRKGTLIVTAPVPEDLLHIKVILSAAYMDSVQSGGDASESDLSVAANIQQVKNGNLLLGSSRQLVGFDRQVDPSVAGEVLASCVRIFPKLQQLSVIRMWAGLRPHTPDLLPVIGAVSSVPGLFIAAGHEGIGITEAPITGLLMRQLITGQPLEVPVEGLSPDRFLKTQPHSEVEEFSEQ